VRALHWKRILRWGLARAPQVCLNSLSAVPTPLLPTDSSARIMARSTDSFFIRATTDINNDNKYQESTIDLGAYVDALGKSVLRIHNIVVTMSDSTGRTSLVDSEAAAQFQLLTQSQATDIGSTTGGIVLPSNRFVVSSGRLCVDGASGVPTYVSTDFDNLPQEWTNGYLVAVDALYLGGAASSGFAGDVYCSVIMECTVETLSQSAAMALALSQQ